MNKIIFFDENGTRVVETREIRYSDYGISFLPIGSKNPIFVSGKYQYPDSDLRRQQTVQLNEQQKDIQEILEKYKIRYELRDSEVWREISFVLNDKELYCSITFAKDSKVRRAPAIWEAAKTDLEQSYDVRIEIYEPGYELDNSVNISEFCPYFAQQKLKQLIEKMRSTKIEEEIEQMN